MTALDYVALGCAAASTLAAIGAVVAIIRAARAWRQVERELRHTGAAHTEAPPSSPARAPAYPPPPDSTSPWYVPPERSE